MIVICSWAFTSHHTMYRPGAADCGMAYLKGLEQLGHEVYLFEEVTKHRIRDSERRTIAFDRWGGRGYFEDLMRAYGIWPRASLIYEQGEATHGLAFDEVVSVARRADLLLDIGTSLHSPHIMDNVGVRAYVDEAPGKTQVYHSEYGIDLGLDLHDYFFSVGLNIGTEDSPIPDCGKHWRGIHHPVDLQTWPTQPSTGSDRFSTITNWASKETFAVDGRYSGEKSDNWWKFIDIPSRVDQPFEISPNFAPGYEADREELARHGWNVSDATNIRTFEDYRRFIGGSRAEFSVANNRYVEFNTGWFSDRSARYLASGKPVLVQSTGVEKHLPTGEGMLTFSDVDEVVAGIERINAEYEDHCRAARALAEEYYDAPKVLAAMLEEIRL